MRAYITKAMVMTLPFPSPITHIHTLTHASPPRSRSAHVVDGRDARARTQQPLDGSCCVVRGRHVQRGPPMRLEPRAVHARAGRRERRHRRHVICCCRGKERRAAIHVGRADVGTVARNEHVGEVEVSAAHREHHRRAAGGVTLVDERRLCERSVTDVARPQQRRNHVRVAGRGRDVHRRPAILEARGVKARGCGHTISQSPSNSWEERERGHALCVHVVSDEAGEGRGGGGAGGRAEALFRAMLRHTCEGAAGAMPCPNGKESSGSKAGASKWWDAGS
eukprot:319857-Chlamydomonas_euryale.AAC.7